MLSYYNPQLHGLAEPLARVLLRANVRPNHLTILGFGVSVAAASAFAQGRLRWGAALLILAGLFDFFDGALARLAGQETSFGAFLDSVVDRYSDLVVLLGIVLLYHRQGDGIGVLLTLIALVGTVMVSYTKARAQSIGIECDSGFMERPERIITLVTGALFLVLTYAMLVLAVLTQLTALQRIFCARRMTQPHPGLDAAAPPTAEPARRRTTTSATPPRG
jgi:CDP-diacylglycerol--glycerol-3-phosphate 3-phosphatidyltransferase